MATRAEEHSQLQLVEREDIEDEEDLFEAIDKCALVSYESVLASSFWFQLRFRRSCKFVRF